jgi:hypothetical protein
MESVLRLPGATDAMLSPTNSMALSSTLIPSSLDFGAGWIDYDLHGLEPA